MKKKHKKSEIPIGEPWKRKKEKAKEAIRMVGEDRVKKYYLGVKE